MLKCVSAAPFGVPVVPLVNWMLKTSSGSKVRPMASITRLVQIVARRPKIRERQGSGDRRRVAELHQQAKFGEGGALEAPGRRPSSSSGISDCEHRPHSRCDLKRGAKISARQPTQRSANSSSMVR